MRMTLDDVQSRVAAVTDLDQDTTNIPTDDYSLRTTYINMAQKEWAEAYDWSVLYTEYNMLVSTSTGNASVVLPANFRKLASYPKIMVDSTAYQFSQVRPEEDDQYSDNDKRVWILGSPNSQYILRVFGASLSSGASVKVPYYRSPASLATGTDIAEVPNADYLVQRTIAYVWGSKEDARFPTAKAEAEIILQNMLEFEQVPSRASDWDRVKTVEETRYNFRLGRD